jgi:hypothetical protein
VDLEDASKDDLVKMVRDLRQEAGGYRTKLRTFEDVFGQFDPDTSRGLLGLVNQLAQDEESAAMLLRDLSYDILGERVLEDAPWKEETDTEEQEDDVNKDEQIAALLEQVKTLTETVNEIKGFTEEEKSQREQANNAEVEAVIAEAKALGYEPGSPAFMHLMFTASQGDGDLEAAHKVVGPLVGMEVKTEDEPSEDESEEGEGEKRYPSTAKANAGTPGLKKSDPPDTWAEANDRVMDFLDSIPE